MTDHVHNGRAPSIRDVARVAGVSTTTVSTALNGGGRLGENTRRRVVEVAQELGYRANPNARHLRGSSTGLVGLITRVAPDATWMANDLEFVTRVTQAISAASWRHGYFPTLLPSDVSSAAVVGLPLAGVIVIDPFRDDPLITALQAAGIAVVCVSPTFDGADPPASWVDTNTAEATHQLLQELETTGVRRALLLSSDAEQSYLTEPARAFRDWAAAASIEADVELLPVTSGPADAYRIVHAAAGDARLDLVYVVTEAFIPAVLAGLRDADRSIPMHVQVVTASDSVHGRVAMPPLTSLDLRPEQLGAAAVDALHAALGGSGVESFVVDAEVIRRGSTRAPARIR